ncbi:hypothetical protein C4571_03600 [Candidatus Parcubacteria bacterium]|nr:MAG: hypothetical protein C4571_03600 [Candidatus Parcubacteria bacterium]
MCQNCKSQFQIELEDFDFYKKTETPPPTFCPQCRFQRRLAFWNLLNLYRRPCDLCKKDGISMYRPELPHKVYCPRCWWSDDWDPLEYGREYDFSRPFFEQINDLWHKVPLLGISIDKETLATSPYTNHCGHLKNCYLVFHADYNEDCSYGVVVFHSKSILDCSLITLSELCYDSMHSFKNSRCIGVNHTIESIDCLFTKDSANCQSCFASANLRNKKYHIFNKPHTKEEYLREIGKWDLGSYRQYQEVKRLAEEHWKNFAPKPRHDEMSQDISGNYVFESKNCKECFEVTGAQDCKYLFLVGGPPVRDCYDVSGWGNNMSLSYEGCIIGEYASNLKFCQEAGLNLYNADYSKLSTGGSNHFGCVSVKKGDFCILNKRYSEEEYKKLREKIIKHMNEMPYKDRKGRTYAYGEFFPVEVSPFAYNETVANDLFPLSKAEALKERYSWAEPETRAYSTTKQAADLPDHIKDASDDLLKEVVACEMCGKGFKIISMELDFLRKMNLPLPRQCPFCRINGKFRKWIKNLRIFKRNCSTCGTEFECSYPQEEVAKILCKKCYLDEVV